MLENPTRLLIVDDHALVLEVIRSRLERESWLTVVGSTSSPAEAVAIARYLEPDLLLIDIDLARASGFEIADQIKSLRPAIRCIFLSGFVYDRYIQEAFRQKARGYLSKRDPPDVLVKAVRAVANGGEYLSEEVMRRLVIDRREPTTSDRRTKASMLTRREKEVLGDIARGYAKKEIARRDSVSVKTVERHCENLMAKLNIHDRVALARFAIREQLAEP